MSSARAVLSLVAPILSSLPLARSAATYASSLARCVLYYNLDTTGLSSTHCNHEVIWSDLGTDALVSTSTPLCFHISSLALFSADP
jgi:hypothetical protein